MSKSLTYVTPAELPDGPTPSDLIRTWTEEMIRRDGGDPTNVLDTLGNFLAHFRAYAKLQGFKWNVVETRAREILVRYRQEGRSQAEPTE